MEEAGTRTEQVYRRLKADILGGVIEPGTALPFAKLKDDYGASMGVLREALMRLSAEGLTVNQPQFGFKVISLSLEDLTDLTETRCMIEAQVLRDSVTNGDLEWETRVLSAHHRMERTPKFENGAEYEVVKRDVTAEHREIVDLALARKPEEAAAALVRHLAATRDLILKGTRAPQQ